MRLQKIVTVVALCSIYMVRAFQPRRDESTAETTSRQSGCGCADGGARLSAPQQAHPYGDWVPISYAPVQPWTRICGLGGARGSDPRLHRHRQKADRHSSVLGAPSAASRCMSRGHACLWQCSVCFHGRGPDPVPQGSSAWPSHRPFVDLPARSRGVCLHAFTPGLHADRRHGRRRVTAWRTPRLKGVLSPTTWNLTSSPG